MPAQAPFLNTTELKSKHVLAPAANTHPATCTLHVALVHHHHQIPFFFLIFHLQFHAPPDPFSPLSNSPNRSPCHLQLAATMVSWDDLPSSSEDDSVTSKVSVLSQLNTQSRVSQLGFLSQLIPNVSLLFSHLPQYHVRNGVAWLQICLALDVGMDLCVRSMWHLNLLIVAEVF